MKKLLHLFLAFAVSFSLIGLTGCESKKTSSFELEEGISAEPLEFLIWKDHIQNNKFGYQEDGYSGGSFNAMYLLKITNDSKNKFMLDENNLLLSDSDGELDGNIYVDSYNVNPGESGTALLYLDSKELDLLDNIGFMYNDEIHIVNPDDSFILKTDLEFKKEKNSYSYEDDKIKINFDLQASDKGITGYDYTIKNKTDKEVIAPKILLYLNYYEAKTPDFSGNLDEFLSQENIAGPNLYDLAKTEEFIKNDYITKLLNGDTFTLEEVQQFKDNLKELGVNTVSDNYEVNESSTLEPNEEIKQHNDLLIASPAVDYNLFLNLSRY